MLKVDYEKCTGCYACYNICPKHCIELKLNDEGFRYPVVDSKTCISCNLCNTVCPIYNKNSFHSIKYTPHSYACYSSEQEILKNSVTAGVCFLICKNVIDNGGVAFGVVGNVVSRVYHTIATNIEELLPMRGSKYLQSEVLDTFKIAKKQLDIGKVVVYTGTPCQIAGLYAFLGKDYENLLTIDLICHGVPSKMVFDKYISEVEAAKENKVIYVGRDKSKGWRPCSFRYEFDDGTYIIQKGTDNIFNIGFTTNIFQRKSCLQCKYAKIPRIADITVGDYFQGQKAELLDKYNQGLSLITCNTEKGVKAVNDLGKQIIKWEYPIEEVVKESEHLANSPRNNIFRRTFFWIIKRTSFAKTARLMLPQSIIGKSIRRFYGLFCYIYEWIKSKLNHWRKDAF